MTMRLSIGLRTARLQLLADAIDAAATPGRLRLYGGDRPDTGAPAGGPILCELVLEQPCATVAEAVLTFAAGVEALRLVAGAITWGRFTDGDGAFVGDVDVSAADGSGDLRLNVVDGFEGATIRLVAGAIAE